MALTDHASRSKEPKLSSCLAGEFPEDWVWNVSDKSPEAVISSDLENVYFHTDPVEQSTGTAGVRGTKAFTEGEHWWEIVFLEPPVGTSVMVGVGTKKALLHTSNYKFVNLIGLDAESWGLSYKGTIWHNGVCHDFCEPFFDQTTVIGCHLNLYDGTLIFYKNGESLGLAFTGLDKVGEALYPIVSSTATDTELGLGLRKCRYMTLQEKCLCAIRKQLQYADCVDKLPLPPILKTHMKEM